MSGKPGRSGGMRPGSGPPPAEESRAKDRAAKRAARGLPALVDDGDWLTLPRAGRGGNPPAWPLSTATARERVVWRRQWKRPQALAWETLGDVTEQVAMYVRYLVEAEQPDATVGVRNLVRQYADGLGISPVGMRMLRWRIGQVTKPPAAGDAPGTPAAPRPVPGLSPKERLKLVSNGPGG